MIKIWSYCVHCWDRTQQYFLRDEGIYELYECEQCHQIHKVAVR
jgi:hypothetical protein